MKTRIYAAPVVKELKQKVDSLLIQNALADKKAMLTTFIFCPIPPDDATDVFASILCGNDASKTARGNFWEM